MALAVVAAHLFLLAATGCGILPFPMDTSGVVQGSLGAADSRIVASVTATSPETGLPTSLSGTVSGQYEGTYQEEILDVFFDSTGAPIAALSRSQFTLDTPDGGTLVSLNLVVVADLIPLTDATGSAVLDEQGAPTITGLQSAATGEIIHGTGAFAGATGELHTDTVLYFTGGDFELGSVESELVITLDADAAE
jgi:hypothetical protein